MFDLSIPAYSTPGSCCWSSEAAEEEFNPEMAKVASIVTALQLQDEIPCGRCANIFDSITSPTHLPYYGEDAFERGHALGLK